MGGKKDKRVFGLDVYGQLHFDCQKVKYSYSVVCKTMFKHEY